MLRYNCRPAWDGGDLMGPDGDGHRSTSLEYAITMVNEEESLTTSTQETSRWHFHCWPAGVCHACQDGKATAKKSKRQGLFNLMWHFCPSSCKHFLWDSGLSEHNSVTSADISPPRRTAKRFVHHADRQIGVGHLADCIKFLFLIVMLP